MSKALPLRLLKSSGLYPFAILPYAHFLSCRWSSSSPLMTLPLTHSRRSQRKRCEPAKTQREAYGFLGMQPRRSADHANVYRWGHQSYSLNHYCGLTSFTRSWLHNGRLANVTVTRRPWQQAGGLRQGQFFAAKRRMSG